MRVPEFLGRRRELADLRAGLDRAGLDTMAGRPAARCRVLLVAGRPGTGRTALAEKFAAELVAEGGHRNGVLRARLTGPGGVPEPAERAVRELLAALGVRPPVGADDGELIDVLHEALSGRRAVLLLDDVASARQLAELVPDGRDNLVLAVSTGPLTGVPDVRPCTLGGLDRQTALRLLARGAGPVRIANDPSAADRLAEACGDRPAALVLAAGWLAAHPEATVADALRRLSAARDPAFAPPEDPEAAGAAGPGEGEGGGRADPPKDQEAAEVPAGAGDLADEPLRRAFLLAHSGLPAHAARLLRLLVLAPAGLVDAHTAGALAGCPFGVARATLADLAAAGLLRLARPTVVGGAEAGAGDGEEYAVPGCFDPLLRALLRHRERPGELLLARARMLERTVRRLRACQAVTEPRGSAAREWLAGQPAALRFPGPAAANRWLAAHRTALLAVARLAVADGELDTLARRVIAALGHALLAHLGDEEAAPDLYRLHEFSLTVADRQRLAGERAAALLNLGDLDARAGRPAAALDRYRAALEAARGEREQVEDSLVGRALESLGATYASGGDWPRAADWFGRALALRQARGDLAAVARLQGRAADALHRAGLWDEALRGWRAAAAAHRRRGETGEQAVALARAAEVQDLAGWPEDALRTGEDALRLAARAGDLPLQAALRARLADCAERCGRPAEARQHRSAAARLPAAPPAPRDRAHREPPGGQSSGSAEGTAFETQNTRPGNE
ncbi:hypothetical protein D7294_08265 [Streptomyces hoynatensis]|uniref:AAA+ ATPase domain-containing protein n=2 Tax=Streptomyces hoynatensis TaxID=1141874 RepID=A0A3A9Z6V7_9ACTN|nr:hypothetical protein D7294_08265 [Streptomyces hoynatensis]